MGRHLFHLVVIAAAALSMSAPSYAEREALARLAHEIAALEPLVNAAERDAHSQPVGRVRFRYDWLRRDLDRIHAGVLEEVMADQAEPRFVQPLRGDYRR